MASHARPISASASPTWAVADWRNRSIINTPVAIAAAISSKSRTTRRPRNDLRCDLIGFWGETCSRAYISSEIGDSVGKRNVDERSRGGDHAYHKHSHLTLYCHQKRQRVSQKATADY